MRKGFACLAGWLLSMALSGCADLYDATTANDFSAVRAMLAEGQSANGDGSRCYSPLMRAMPSMEMVSYLIKQGADVNYKDPCGFYALHEAARFGYVEIADLLIRQGANVNSRGAAGNTPLIQAKCLPMQTLLLENGADVNVSNAYGQTALMDLVITIAALHPADGEKRLSQLIDKGADLNARDTNGNTALMSAATLGLADVVALLVERGADPKRQDKQGRTALNLAKNSETRRAIDRALEKANAAVQEQKRREAQQQLEARIAAQPCPLNETFWFMMRGMCVNELLEGEGEAESRAGGLRFQGTFKRGKLFAGKLYRRDGQLVYEGPFLNGKEHGKGFCPASQEACEWQDGKRIDAPYLERVKREEAVARERAAREELARLEAEARERERQAREERQEEAQRRKAIRDCERLARRETDENTNVTCDSEGNPQYYRHNRGTQVRMARVMDSFKHTMESAVPQTANPGVVYRTPAVPAQSPSGKPSSVSSSALSQEIQNARRKLESAEQEVRRQPSATPTPVPAAKPAATAPVWGSPVPEALVACWQNSGRTLWFCDGPLQQTSVGEADLNAVSKLVGCGSDLRDMGTSGQYRLFGCNRGLKLGERDLRKLKGVSGGNSYRCLKADMEAGKTCRQLSDY